MFVSSSDIIFSSFFFLEKNVLVEIKIKYSYFLSRGGNDFTFESDSFALWF
jgi:hypothetical protein